MRFAEMTAVVTGGAAGIGRQTTEILAREGARVVVADRDLERAEQARDAALAAGAPEALAVPYDAAEASDAERLAATCRDAFGGVDVLVNNAAARVWGPVTQATAESWRHIVDVNLIGVGVACQHLIPLMSGRPSAAIVNVSSANAIVGRGGMAQYDATKAAVLGLTRSMACDHAEENIRVNAVLPGPTLTDFHKNRAAEAGRSIDPAVTTPHEGGPGIMRRQGRPEEIAHAIVFLASPQASFITGTCLSVDGGLAAVSGRLS